MNILGKEFITELMPDGWVIYEKWLDGALSVIDNQLSLGISPEQYWQERNGVIIAQLIHQIH